MFPFPFTSHFGCLGRKIILVYLISFAVYGIHDVYHKRVLHITAQCFGIKSYHRLGKDFNNSHLPLLYHFVKTLDMYTYTSLLMQNLMKSKLSTSP